MLGQVVMEREASLFSKMSTFDSKIYERDIYEDSIYSAWLKYSNERDVLEEFLRKNFERWVKKNNLSILDIGCGSGSAARRIMRILDDRVIAYTYTGVDPYRDQLDRWAEWLPEDKRVTLIKDTIENFKPDKTYDLVVVVHALYYVDDLRGALEKIRSWGKIALIVHHGERGINEIHQALRSLVKEGPNIISTYNKVKNELDIAKIPYDFDVVMTQVDIRPCHDPKNEDGRKLIRFFLEHSELSEDIIENVSLFLKSKGDFMKQDVGYFFISK